MKMAEDKVAIYVEEQEATQSGVYIPELYRKVGVVLGTVVEVGPGRLTPTGVRVPPQCKKGDRVVFNNIAALKINYKKTSGEEESKPLWICKEVEIIAVLDEDESILDAMTNKAM